jgi:uncharacterized protein YicC (UPF0701 family)
MTNTKTEGERLVKLEVKVENIEKMVTSMDTKLDNILQEQNNARIKTVSRQELEGEIRRLELAFEMSTKETKADIKETKRKNSFTVFITGSLAALFGSVMTLLLSYFIQNIGN